MKETKHDEAQSGTASDEGVARKYCGSCHAFPAPALLDKTTWVNDVLPAMGHRFGLYPDRKRASLIEKGMAGKIVEQLNIFPAEPTITEGEWARIISFYEKQAPDSLILPLDPSSPITSSPFEVVVPRFNIERPAVSAITYDVHSSKLYVADCSRENSSSVTILDSSFKPLTSLGLPFPVSNLTLLRDTLYILMMGHFVPSDEPAGQLIKAVKNKSGDYKGYQVVIKGLRRPVDVAYADVDDDGDEDILVCEFGNHTGSASLFIKEGKQYKKKVLMDLPGAIKVIVEDLNNDSRKDLIVLMAQGDEGVDLYYNEGNGQFKRERVLQFPPVYGSVSISLTDFNGDGFKDLVYVNGDNADASRIVKPYHGIRVFLNDQHQHFNESFFYFFPGAYKAIAYDFDGDHDTDLAAISFFPDFNQRAIKSFVYLENISEEGHLEFIPSTLRNTETGRWITMIDADINQDGRMDLLLGSFTSVDIPGDSLGLLKKSFQKDALPLMLLVNRANKKK
ncbi:MAG TPA: VCBS repeat-containing protein [Cyclobacteriaceae bacterium]|nr:VCBS repeat-containing protein [Cyclobacteriaceae bacterium]